MSETEQMDVLIALYLFEDLGRKDYDAVMDLVEEKAIAVQGVVARQQGRARRDAGDRGR